MAKVHHVKAARKPIKEAGVKVGESYYWWKFRRGARRVSKTYPRRSQLTQSDFLSQAYDIEDHIAALKAQDYMGDPDSLKSDLDDIASEIRSLGEEQADKLSNMPDSLQNGPTGELLQQRADECEAWADEIEGIEVDVPEDADEDGVLSAIEAAIQEAQGAGGPTE
jgi:hypothetical protein